jgi:hypothetical protein
MPSHGGQDSKLCPLNDAGDVSSQMRETARVHPCRGCISVMIDGEHVVAGFAKDDIDINISKYRFGSGMDI